MKLLAQLIQHGNLIQHCLDDSLESTFQQEVIETDSCQVRSLAPGIFELCPPQYSASLVLSCGIHGNETAPIELVELLFREIINGSVALNCRLMIIMGNLPAMRNNQRFCEENLNRLFKKEPFSSNNIETRRASEIMPVVDTFFADDATEVRIHLDLHTAIRGSFYEKFAIYPFQSTGQWHQPAIGWLANAGIQAVLLANKSSGTFSCYTDHIHDAIGFTVELGKARAFGENDHSRLRLFKTALWSLLEKPQLMLENDYPIGCQVFQVVDEVLRHSDDFTLNLSDDFENFSPLERGYELTTDGRHSYRIKSDSSAVVFPNKNVPIGQRVALIVEPSS